jgi:uncharacterized protein YndB with AHSA1/START domain
MPTVRAERTIEAPIEEVFDLLTDHANYDTYFRIVRRAELLREGRPHPNGVGALRRVVIAPLVFEEEITAFERPVRMDYLIREINAPMEHEGGSMRFESTDTGTRVVWSSTYRVPLRLVGGVAGATTARVTALGFRSVLSDAAKRLEA